MVDEYVLGDVERISPESPVPVVVAHDRLRKLGGAGNVVKNLVAMGGKVALFAAVGKDNPGVWFKENCEEMAVESFWLKDDPSRPTTIKTRVVARNQQIVRIDEERISDIPFEIERAVLKTSNRSCPRSRQRSFPTMAKVFSQRPCLKPSCRLPGQTAFLLWWTPRGWILGGTEAPRI